MHEERELNHGLLPTAFILSHAWVFEVMPIRGRGQRAHQHNTKHSTVEYGESDWEEEQ